MSTSMLTLSNLRSVIVDALTAANIPTIDGRVFSSRTENVWNEEGNLICIYTNNNQFDDGDRNPVIYKVTSEVIVDVIVQGDQVIDVNGEQRVFSIADQMDFITNKVLSALVRQPNDTNLYRKLNFKKVRLTSVQNTLAGAGEFDKGTQRISLEYTWYMELPILGTPDDEFLLAHTKIVTDGGAELVFDTATRSQQ